MKALKISYKLIEYIGLDFSASKLGKHHYGKIYLTEHEVAEWEFIKDRYVYWQHRFYAAKKNTK